jgi:hypothetical protein
MNKNILTKILYSKVNITLALFTWFCMGSILLFASLPFVKTYIIYAIFQFFVIFCYTIDNRSKFWNKEMPSKSGYYFMKGYKYLSAPTLVYVHVYSDKLSVNINGITTVIENVVNIYWHGPIKHHSTVD